MMAQLLISMSRRQFIMLIILFFIFMISLVTSANPQYRVFLTGKGTPVLDQTRYNYVEYKGEPSFEIIVDADKYRLDRGQTCKLNIFITGAESKF